MMYRFVHPAYPLNAAELARAEERRLAAAQRARDRISVEVPDGRTNDQVCADIRAALEAFKLSPEDQAILDASEAVKRRDAKARRVRARVKVKKEAAAKRDRAQAKAKKEEDAWRARMSRLPAALREISLYGRSGRTS